MSQQPSSSQKKPVLQQTPKSSKGESRVRVRRRKVAEELTETHPENVKSLLAALEKAQGSNAPNLLSTSKEVKVKEILGDTETPKVTQSEPKKQTVGARVAQRNRQVSRTQETPTSSRQRNSNSVTAGPSKTPSGGGFYKKPLPIKIRVPNDVLDDLIFRFIEHIPEHEKNERTRVMFQVELAHWFYVDYYMNKEMRPDCPNMNMREFSWCIFSHSPAHRHMAKKIDEVLDEWRGYKSNVPTYGAILLDKTLTKVVLVQGYYASKNSWGFPKGKINENEDPRDCAAREVHEETGYNFLDPEHRPEQAGKEHIIQKTVGETMVRLYVITDVPMEFKFEPKTKNEIRKIQWFNVCDLPTDKFDPSHALTSNNNNFYTVIPFVTDLISYIRKEQTRRAKAQAAKQAKMTPTDMLNSLSQVNMDQGSMTPGKSADNPNILSNLFNNFLPNNPPKRNQLPHQSQEPLFQLESLYNSPNVLQPSPRINQTKASQMAVSATSAFSPFKPVENENLAQSLLNIVKPPKQKTSPKIAHPIALPGRPNLPTMDQSSQQQRPTPPNKKIGSNEASAFKAIPKNKSSNSLKDSEMGSIFGSELALDRLGEMRELPSGSTDITDDIRRGENYFTVQLCDAWKNFKLDTTNLAIELEPIPTQQYQMFSYR